MRHEYFECSCHSDEHRLVFALDDDPAFPDLYTSVYLNHYRGVCKRIWVAIRYVFGYRSKYGAFDCFMLHDLGEAQRLRDLLDRTVLAIEASQNWCGSSSKQAQPEE